MQKIGKFLYKTVLTEDIKGDYPYTEWVLKRSTTDNFLLGQGNLLQIFSAMEMKMNIFKIWNTT